MNDVFLQSAALDDTSLALPASYSPDKVDWKDRSVRVQQQVRHTLARKSTKRSLSNGGVSSQKNTAWDPDANDGSIFDKQANGSAIFSSSLTNGHVRRATMRIAEASEPKPESSYKRSSYYRMNSAPTSASQSTYRFKSVRQTKGPQQNLNRGTILGRSESKTASTRFNSRSSQLRTAEQKSMRLKPSQKSLKCTKIDAVTSEADEAGSVFQQTAITRQKSMKPQQMTLEQAVRYLKYDNKEKLIPAASFIQSQCYSDDAAKKMMQELKGIKHLLRHLNDSEDMRRVVAGALRNIVYKNNKNKEQVKNCDDKKGLDIIIEALKESREKETKRQLTGLLWNLSAHDDLKDEFPKLTGDVLTKKVLVPSSGIFKDENPKHELHGDSDAFFYATGCLRNLSCARSYARQSLRETENLIDSLVHYTQEAISNQQTKDKTLENCVCVLHNLTYEWVEPECETQNDEESKHLAVDQAPSGCYSRPRAKIPVKKKGKEEPSSENRTPKPTDGLHSPITVRLYLTLLACSKEETIVKAAIGGLQNITASKRTNIEEIAKTIQEKDRLNDIMKIFTSDAKDLRTAVFSLTKNLSRIEMLHSDIARVMMPELVNTLSIEKASEDEIDEKTSTCFYILKRLCMSEDKEIATSIISSGLLNSIFGISIKKIGRRHTAMAREACSVLHTMWKNPKFQKVLKQKGYVRSKFINKKTMKALNSNAETDKSLEESEVHQKKTMKALNSNAETDSV